MNIDPEHPQKEDRDRFVLSKGHCAPAYYAALAERGYFPVEELDSLRKFGSMLQGHPDMKHIPGVDMSTGSLGQGVSAAAGMAYGLQMQHNPAHVYALLGDGELQEGQVWEAAMFAGSKGLNNLTLIIDNNNLQIDGCVDQVMSIYPLEDKLKAFNAHVITIDGHNFDEIRAALKEARKTKGCPTVIVAKTIKGKGVSFMEDVCNWHGVAPKEDEYKAGMAELEEKCNG